MNITLLRIGAQQPVTKLIETTLPPTGVPNLIYNSLLTSTSFEITVSFYEEPSFSNLKMVYGTTTGFGNEVIKEPPYIGDISFLATSLSPNTTYYYKIYSQNIAGIFIVYEDSITTQS